MADDIDPDLRDGSRRRYTREVERQRRGQGLRGALAQAQTQAGGSGPPAITGGRAVVPAEPPRPPAVRTENLPVPRREGAVAPQAVIDGDPPRQMRDVPNRATQAALPAPETPAAPPSAANRAGRITGQVLRRAAPVAAAASMAHDVLAPTQVADATLPEGQRYGGQRPDDEGVADNAAKPPAEEVGEERTIPAPPPAPPGERPARRARGGSSGPARRGRSEADELNELSLRAIRGEPASTTDPRDANIRRRMATAGLRKGGGVGKECYASGGAIGSRDGIAKSGKTRGRFC